MELTHQFSVPTSLDRAWASFNDLSSIAPCFPGASITSIDGDDFTGTVKIKLGPISMLYNGSGTFVTRDETAHRAVIEAKGKDRRGNGTASATVSATFSGEGEQTVVEVSTDLVVTGKPAQFGRGVISDISDKLLQQFVDCISARFSASEVAGAGSPGAADPPAADVPERMAEVHGGRTDSEPVSTGLGPAGGGAQSGGASGVAPSSGGAEAPHEFRPGHWESPPTGSGARTEPAELNVLSTAVPVLAKRYGPAALGTLAVVLVLIRVVRRRRH